jgi:hypothetical protein
MPRQAPRLLLSDAGRRLVQETEADTRFLRDMGHERNRCSCQIWKNPRGRLSLCPGGRVSAAVFAGAPFVDKLPKPMNSWLLPSLIFCTICSTFIGWLHTMFFIRNDRKRITPQQFTGIVCSQAALIVALFVYWFWRGVI